MVHDQGKRAGKSDMNRGACLEQGYAPLVLLLGACRLTKYQAPRYAALNRLARLLGDAVVQKMRIKNRSEKYPIGYRELIYLDTTTSQTARAIITHLGQAWPGDVSDEIRCILLAGCRSEPGGMTRTHRDLD
jgi:hypothetical protein